MSGGCTASHQVDDQKDDRQSQEDMNPSRSDMKGQPGDGPRSQQEKENKEEEQVAKNSHAPAGAIR